MLRRKAPLLLAFALAAALLARAAGTAAAEEALVLDNGAVLRGSVVRDDGATLVFRLSGVASDSRITVARERIVRRFATVDPRAPALSAEPSAEAAPPRPPPSPALVRAAPPLPEEEPHAGDESFFRRTARRAAMALPADAGSRAFLAALAVLVGLCLVGLACRMAEVTGATLGKTTLLALLFVGLVALDVAWADTVLRADRASVLLPLEILAWVGCAAGVLRCGLGRAFHLLAFVVVAAALVVFSAGVVLVSV